MSTTPLPTAVVTAVVVAHDGARWLPGLVAALAAQVRPPDVVVAADTGSTDTTPALLADWLGPDAVATCDRAAGFGSAVAAALQTGPAAAAVTDWVWLLHDDCVPEPGALDALLAEVARDPTVGLAGPKVRSLGADAGLLLEVGVTIARSGRRETLLERRERDQGQHDGVHRVLAVGSAGMLVRRDVWDELGGFDPRVPLLRDDVDLGWRATLAGHRVVCVTDAVVGHAEAVTRRRRQVHAGGHRLHRLDRQHALHVLLANLPLLHLPVALVSLSVASLVRALGYLVGKLPRHAADELGALIAVVGRPHRLVAARRRRRRTRRVPARSALPLLAPRSAGLRHLMETAALVSGTGAGDVAGGRHRGAPSGAARAGTAAPGTGPTSEEDEDLPSWGTGLLRRFVLRPSVGVVVVLVLVTALAARALVGDGRLLGGALLPAPDHTVDLWRTYVSAWHPVGVGSDTPAPPYLAVLAALSGLLGAPEHAVDLVLLGAVPLAGATAYLAARRVAATVPVRVWAAATYALLPATLGAVAAGRLGTAVLAVLLPLIGLTTVRALGLDPSRGEGSTRAAWGAALLLGVATAFVPGVAGLVLVLALLALLVVRGRDRLRLAILVVVPVALLLPWLPALVADPQLLLLEAGLPGPALSDPDPEPLSLLLLHPGGPGGVPMVLTAPLLVLALASLLRPDRRRPVLAGWLLAGTGMVAAVLQSRTDVTAPTLQDAVPAWPGPALLLAGAGLVLAAATGAQGARARVAGSSFGWRQPAAAVLAALALVMPLVVAGWWAVAGAGDPLDRRDPVLLPAFVAAEGDQAARPRTLVLRARAPGDLTYALLRSEGPRTGDAEVAPAASATTALDRVVADLASGRGGDAAARLVPYGVRFVLLARPADPAVARAVDAVPGMVRVSGAGGTVLWRVDYRTGRLRLLPAGAPVVGPDGAPPDARVVPAGQVQASSVLPPGEPDRLLVLADPRDDGWRATVDGVRLQGRGYDGWAQAFVVPGAGGRLSLTHDQGLRTLLLWVQLAAVVLVAVLALPKLSTEEDDEIDESDVSDGTVATHTGGDSATTATAGARRLG
jgi:GT2 family glycosyltransferase